MKLDVKNMRCLRKIDRKLNELIQECIRLKIEGKQLVWLRHISRMAISYCHEEGYKLGAVKCRKLDQENSRIRGAKLNDRKMLAKGRLI